MRKSRLTDEQIVGFLKQAEAGLPVKELCRKNGFSDATFYKWRARFGGMEAIHSANHIKQSGHPSRWPNCFSCSKSGIRFPCEGKTVAGGRTDNASMRRLAVAGVVLIFLAAVVIALKVEFRRDMERHAARIVEGSRLVTTACGPVELAEAGPASGAPVLVACANSPGAKAR